MNEPSCKPSIHGDFRFLLLVWMHVKTALCRKFYVWKRETMGCSFCKQTKAVDVDDFKPKEYSWDKRDKVDPKDFLISNLKGEDVCRLPGSVNGQQFMIQNCTNSTIYIFDHSDSINIDDCSNCNIVLGPIKGSLFVRDCVDCVIVVACGQFRLRDCLRLDIFLHCVTQPIIESSTHIRFTCFRMHYSKLTEHLAAAKLSVYNNLWNQVHDFTPVDGDCNWSKLPDSVRLQDYVTPPFPPELERLEWNIRGDHGAVPVSYGYSERYQAELCLVLVLDGCHKTQYEEAEMFLSTFQEMKENSQCVLLTSREIQLHSADAEAMQLGSHLNTQLEKGPVVGFVFGGKGCLEVCRKAAARYSSDGQLYISADYLTSRKQVNSFLQCASMHLGI